MVELNNFICGNCMDYLPEFPDKYFDLAIVDPPYGIGKKLLRGGNTGVVKFHELYAENEWDEERPSKEYFEQLFRVSKNQIIWGANYFLDMLYPSRGIISWDKNLGEPLNFSHWEMAWTSFDCIARKVTISSNTGNRIHPTQKPIALYDWILSKYAKQGDKILDTHVGSGSSLISCHNNGFDYVGFEIDSKYYESAKNRLEQHKSQLSIFDFGIERSWKTIETQGKDTPKKPEFNGNNWYRCINGCEVHKKPFERDFFCPKCGQAIDWSEEEKDTTA